MRPLPTVTVVLLTQEAVADMTAPLYPMKISLLALFALVTFPILAPAAVPTTAPSGKIKVLLVDGFSNHDWRKNTAILKAILEPTSLFDLDVSTCPPNASAPGYNEWRPAFKGHDVVIQTCNNIDRAGPPWTKEVQTDFENYVRDGGGVYIYHSAQNAFADWPAYNDIIGLGWRPATYGTAISINDDGSLKRYAPGEGRATGHDSNSDVVVRQLGEHPIHAGMPKAWLTPHLEVYYFARGPAENVTVLSYGRDPRSGVNWPVEWTVNYGKGRAYVATFGHVWRAGRGDNDPENEAVRCVGVQTTIIRVLQWLANRPVTWAVPADFPTETKKSLRPAFVLPAATPAAATPAAPAVTPSSAAAKP